jgi:hypothetical protein
MSLKNDHPFSNIKTFEELQVLADAGQDFAPIDAFIYHNEIAVDEGEFPDEPDADLRWREQLKAALEQAYCMGRIAALRELAPPGTV